MEKLNMISNKRIEKKQLQSNAHKTVPCVLIFILLAYFKVRVTVATHMHTSPLKSTALKIILIALDSDHRIIAP